MITRLGGGSFADVYKAKEKSTGELVAIKVLKKKYKKWEDCLELRECRSLQKLHNDSLSKQKGIENIIKLKQIIFIKKTGTLNLVFEYMQTDLLELMKSKEPKKLSEDQIRDIMHQTLLGLSFMHKYGFFHRDMKPENLLLEGKKVKIGDFGLAREIRSVPPYTEYVSTRYYRAPECILKFTNYNSPIDIWGLGCIMAEMYLHPQPLFFGSNEKEVLFRICSILGTPTYDTWSDGIQQANLIGIKFPTNDKVDLSSVIPNASNEAIDLMNQMLKWDPNRRATASNLLNHPFFTNYTIPNHNIDTKSSNSDSNFDDGCFKKFSNKSQNKLNKKNQITNKEKMMTDNDIDKLINQIKKQKIEEENFNENEFDIGNIAGDSINILESNNSLMNSKNNDNIKSNDFSSFDLNSTNTNNNFYDNEFSLKKDEQEKNNYNEINENENKNNINDDDDEFDFGINSKVQLKKESNKNNKRRSARKFLEETENKFKNSGMNENSVPLFQFDNSEFNNLTNNKPTIIKNEFESRRGDNTIMNKLLNQSNDGMDIGNSGFKQKKFNYSVIPNIGNKSDSLFGNSSRRNHNTNWEI